MKFRVAVVGATGAVGRQLLAILAERKFPVGELVPFASARSEGKSVWFAGKSYPCQVMKKGCFEGIQIAFFDASDAVSKEWVPQAAESGTWVVDNSAQFRLDEDMLLLVPEVNGELLEKRLAQTKITPRERILAGPNCSTVQLVVAMKPIRDRWGIKRIVVSTYQSTSGAGSAAMDELRDHTGAYLAGKPTEPKAFAHPIAFNCIPQIGGFYPDDYTSEESKMIAESRKILGMPGLRMSATAVRVPTLACHGESVNVECEKPFDINEVRKALAAQPGVIVEDDPAKKHYPLGIRAAGRDPVFVGRLRKDPSVEHGLNLWVVSDNLRKGAALNAIQIGEVLARKLS
jgi:aspartate-semialdehyde dehydrogenase